MATSLNIDDELRYRVQYLEDARQRSPHWIMRVAIEQYVKREVVRESFKQEALASWASYQETGRHFAASEIRGWLNAWGDVFGNRCA